MKKRNVFLMLVVFVLGMFAVCFSDKNVKAMEIAEDGEYTLVLNTSTPFVRSDTLTVVSSSARLNRIILKIVGKEVVQKK